LYGRCRIAQVVESVDLVTDKSADRRPRGQQTATVDGVTL